MCSCLAKHDATPRSTRWAGALLLALLLQASSAVSQTSAPQQLEQLAAAQGSALESGDSDRILTTSRQLAALAERLLGTLDQGLGNFGTAGEHYRQSLLLADLPGTRLDLALSYILDGKADAALAETKRVGETGPDGARASRTAAQAYLLKGDTKAASDALTRSWKLVPDLDTGALLVTTGLRGGRKAEADAIAAQMLASSGESARLHLLIAEARHNADDLNGTIADLTRAVALQPEASAYHLALGNAFWELNENQYNADSLREFVAAQRLSPDDFLSNYDLGAILSQYQRFPEAERYLKAAAAADSTSPDPWLQLGMIAYQRGSGPEARMALEKAVALTGSAESQNGYAIRRAYAVLSRICAEEGRQAEADRYAARADDLHAKLLGSNVQSTLSQSTAVGANLAAGPSRPASGTTAPSSTSPQQTQLRQQLQVIAAHSLNDAGTVLARSRDYAGALPLFRQAALADPSLTPAVRNLGIAAFRTGSYAEAASALVKVLTQNPSDSLAQTYLDQARAQSAGTPDKR